MRGELSACISEFACSYTSKKEYFHVFLIERQVTGATSVPKLGGQVSQKESVKCQKKAAADV